MLFESIGFPVAVMAIIAGILGLVITLIFKLFETKVDERVQEVTEALPGANCGACGFSGCAGYAEALCDGSETDTTRCSVGGSDTAQEIAREALKKKSHKFCAKVLVIIQSLAISILGHQLVLRQILCNKDQVAVFMVA